MFARGIVLLPYIDIYPCHCWHSSPDIRPHAPERTPPLHHAGSLPSSWSKLSMLRQMDVRANALTGSVPAAWNSRLGEHLQMLDLSGNQRMCGGALDMGPDSQVHTSLTGLGQDCSALTGGTSPLSGTVGVIFGECMHPPASVVTGGLCGWAEGCITSRLQAQHQPVRLRRLCHAHGVQMALCANQQQVTYYVQHGVVHSKAVALQHTRLT